MEDFQNSFKGKVQRYKCKNYEQYYQTDFPEDFKKYYNYSNSYIENITNILGLEHISLRNMSKLVEIFANRHPSYQTIKNWITQIKEPKIKETKTNFSGYYSFGEQYIKENG